MVKVNYKGLTVPKEVADDIDKLIESDNKRFRSRTDVVKEGVNLLKKEVIPS